MDNEERIESVMNHFNFTNVFTTMEALEWVWGSACGTPNVEQIRETARMLLTNVVEKRSTKSGTGGLEAYTYMDGDAEMLGLRFIAESCDRVVEGDY